MAKRNSRELCRDSWHSVVNIKGRMYSEAPGSEGTQSASTVTMALTASMNMSSGKGGMQSRWLELIIRRAFISGRKSWILPSAVR